MDDLMARTMVENLSKGINPFTGEDVPKTDLCANEEIQKALQFVLYYCSIESYERMLKREYSGKTPLPAKTAPWEKGKEKKTKKRRVRSAARKEWTAEEDLRLYQLHDKEFQTEEQIAKALNRSPTEVRRRISKLFKWIE